MRDSGILFDDIYYKSVQARTSDPPTAWFKIGTLVRAAQAMGLHRDGSQYHLSALETEMRRRIWGQICMLDFRAAEEMGFEPTIRLGSYDTQLPGIYGDDHFNPEETTEIRREGREKSIVTMQKQKRSALHQEESSSRTGLDANRAFKFNTAPKPLPKEMNTQIQESSTAKFTEMTYSLIRLEMVRLFLAILYPSFDLDDSLFRGTQSKAPSLSKEDKKGLIDLMEKRLQDVYKIHELDMDDPIQAITRMTAELLVMKGNLVIQLQDLKRKDRDDPQEGRTHDRDW